MNCTDAQKVIFSTDMLVDEAEHWWKGAHRHIEDQGTEITWQAFQDAFLDKYFPRSVRKWKRDRVLGEYVAKFEELAKFSSYLRNQRDEEWMAINFSPARPLLVCSGPFPISIIYLYVIKSGERIVSIVYSVI